MNVSDQLVLASKAQGTGGWERGPRTFRRLSGNYTPRSEDGDRPDFNLLVRLCTALTVRRGDLLGLNAPPCKQS